MIHFDGEEKKMFQNILLESQAVGLSLGGRVVETIVLA